MLPSDLREIAERYVPGSGALAIQRLGSGLVNDSYRVARGDRLYSLRVPTPCAAELGIDREWECRVLGRAEAAGLAPTRRMLRAAPRHSGRALGGRGGMDARASAPCRKYRMHRATRAAHSRASRAARGAHDEPGRVDRPLSAMRWTDTIRARIAGRSVRGCPGSGNRLPMRVLAHSPSCPRPRPCCATAICTRTTSSSARTVRSCSIGNMPTFRTRCGIWRDGPATTIFAPIPGNCCSAAIWDGSRAPQTPRVSSIWFGCTITYACCGARFTQRCGRTFPATPYPPWRDGWHSASTQTRGSRAGKDPAKYPVFRRASRGDSSLEDSMQWRGQWRG